MDLRKFRDLMASEELYFRRADLFTDRSEGLPTEQYAMQVLRLDPYDIHHRANLNHHLGSLAQHRESYYVSCWYLHDQETLDMWAQYGHDGVAVCSSYQLLKEALDRLLDEVHLGLVRYGTAHLKGTFNALEFITTKQAGYVSEREVRAVLTAYDPLASGNRHIDLGKFPHPEPLDVNPRNSWVPDCKRRRIDLRSLITGVVISPWAEPDAVQEIRLWTELKKAPAAVTHSKLTGATALTLAEFRALRHVVAKRVAEADEIAPTGASDDDLCRLDEVLASLPASRVRFLYKQRWEALRLNPGGIPRLADAQFLERTLRVLDTWKRQGADVG